MKDTVWLHIGTNKTGSTAIQQALKAYDDGTARYARLGRVNHSIPMSILFRHAPGENGFLRQRGMTPAEAEALAEESRALLIQELEGPARTLIISAESLSGFSAPAMQRVADFLAPRSEKVRVLAYVRDPAGYVSSSFQQLVKEGQGSLTLPNPTLRGRLEPSLRSFGREAMEVAAFDRAAFGDGGVVGDAARRMNLQIEGAADAVANQGLSPGAVGLLYFWNRTPDAVTGSRHRVMARNQMIAELGRVLPGKFRLAPDLMRPLVDPGDLAWLYETFGIDFRTAMDDVVPADSDIASEDDLARARDAVFPALVALLKSKNIKDIPATPDQAMSRLYDRKIESVARGGPNKNRAKLAPEAT